MWTSYKNGKKNIVNLLSSSKNEFATKKWYVIEGESNGSYWHENSIKFLTNSIELNLCAYSDEYILVTGDIAVKNGNNTNLGAAEKVAFKNCAPFKNCRTKIDDTFVDEADYINSAMLM